MFACAEFTVRPCHLKGYNDAGYPTLRMDHRWFSSHSHDFPLSMRERAGVREEKITHKNMGEIKGYGSSSPYAAVATNVWLVFFNLGYGNVDDKGLYYSVRLVRSGQ